LFQRVGEETEKASEAKSDLTNGMTSIIVCKKILSISVSPTPTARGCGHG